jgi:hypothetical protein
MLPKLLLAKLFSEAYRDTSKHKKYIKNRINPELKHTKKRTKEIESVEKR